jgi:HSP20 family protein
MSNFPDFWRGGPYRELNQLQKAMDRMWDDFYPATTTASRTPFAFSPKAEFTEEDNRYVAKFDLPGMAKDQIKVELHENMLTVSGERKTEKKEESKGRTYSEVSYGSFSRTMSLPSPVDAEKSKATFENGVLTIAMDKSSKPGARKLMIG